MNEMVGYAKRGDLRLATCDRYQFEAVALAASSGCNAIMVAMSRCDEGVLVELSEWRRLARQAGVRLAVSIHWQGTLRLGELRRFVGRDGSESELPCPRETRLVGELYHNAMGLRESRLVDAIILDPELYVTEGKPHVHTSACYCGACLNDWQSAKGLRDRAEIERQRAAIRDDTTAREAYERWCADEVAGLYSTIGLLLAGGYILDLGCLGPYPALDGLARAIPEGVCLTELLYHPSDRAALRARVERSADHLADLGAALPVIALAAPIYATAAECVDVMDAGRTTGGGGWGLWSLRYVLKPAAQARLQWPHWTYGPAMLEASSH